MLTSIFNNFTHVYNAFWSNLSPHLLLFASYPHKPPHALLQTSHFIFMGYFCCCCLVDYSGFSFVTHWVYQASYGHRYEFIRFLITCTHLWIICIFSMISCITLLNRYKGVIQLPTKSQTNNLPFTFKLSWVCFLSIKYKISENRGKVHAFNRPKTVKN